MLSVQNELVAMGATESDQKSCHEFVEQKPQIRDHLVARSSCENELLESMMADLALDTKFVVMNINMQIKELQTILRNRNTKRADFIFSADRLIRLVIEEGLNQLPFRNCTVETHTGEKYVGCEFFKGICGVSIIRSGEAMEKCLRECCRGIRIGKILMIKDEESDERKVLYARLPPDIDNRKVLLMYPSLMSGGNVILAVETLLEYGVSEDNIYVLTLFATPKSVKTLYKCYPNVSMLTTEVRDEVPAHFGEAYYGTE